jgi:tetratricopeptide (TPR) repeat protein
MNDWMDAEGHADRAFEMYERGMWAEAESELRKALSLNPDQAEWHFNLGLTLEAAGRDRDALASYDRATELLPDQVDPLLASGLVANRLGYYDQAITQLDKALRLDPTSEPAYCNKIEAHVRLGDHDEAETTFYMAQNMLDEPSAHCLAIIAESLIQRHSYARAGWCLKEALRLEPGLPRVSARLGTVYAALGKPQRALQFYLRDLRDDPGNIDTLLDYGELLVELDRLPEAAEKFRRVLELEPANVDAHMRLGQIAMHIKCYEQAHLEFELVLKLDPEFPRIRSALAEALLKRGHFADAQRNLREEYHSLRPKQSGTLPSPAEWPSHLDDLGLGSLIWTSEELAGFGALLMEAKLHAAAADVFAEALKDESISAAKRADWLRRLALARFEMGDHNGGVQCSRRVLRIEPRCVASIHNLALAALQQRRLDVAAGWIDRGLRVDRHDDGLRRLRMRLWLATIKAKVRSLLGLG